MTASIDPSPPTESVNVRSDEEVTLTPSNPWNTFRQPLPQDDLHGPEAELGQMGDGVERYEFAFTDYADAVARCFNLGHDVRRKEHGFALSFFLSQHVLEFVLEQRVQSRSWLV